jgi:putative ABC transport system permease protein
MERLFTASLWVGADALRIHPTRTALSVLGIFIGCAALVATMSVSDGMMSFAREMVMRETSVQVITLSPRTAVFDDGEWLPIHDYPRFAAADAERAREEIPSASAVTLTLSGRADVRLHGTRRRASLVLGSSTLPSFGTLDVGAGRFFSEVEARTDAPVVVLNYALARELAPARDPLGMVGKEVRVNERSRRVIGVLASVPFDDREDPAMSVYAPIAASTDLVKADAREAFAPSMLLLAPTVEAVRAVEEEATEWLARRYARWSERVRVTVGLEQLRQVEQGFLLMKLFVGALVGISLLEGGIGIMNVLLASVAERTREIGIRKSVGARRGDILAQFLTESVAIALVGALAGLAFGFLMAMGVTALFRGWLDVPVHAVLSAGSVAIATVSSSLVGLVFGTYPARRAAAMSPVTAIAHE